MDQHLYRWHLTFNSLPSSSASISVQCAIQSVLLYAWDTQANTCDNSTAANDLMSKLTRFQLTGQVVS